MIRSLFIFFAFSNALIGQTWLQLADFPGLERDDGVGVAVNGKAFFGTGVRVGYSLGGDFYSLDPLNNTWTSITSLPSGAERQYACAFAGPNSFFVFSGSVNNGAQGDLYKYDLAAGTWSLMASKPGGAVQGATCMEFGDKVIIAGGKLGNGPATDEVWEYTISSNTWVQKNNFPFGGRFRASATVLNTTGYLVFGMDQNDLFRKELYSYDPAGDSWSRLIDFPQVRGRAYAALKPLSGKLILFGGLDSLNNYFKDVWYFDPLSPAWQQDANFVSFGRKGGMSTVINNKFYYTCGIDVTNTRQKETWVLDQPLGIEEYETAPVLSIYPNPGSGNFTVKAGSGAQIRIIDETGRTVQQLSLPDSSSQLSVTGLTSGIYIILAEKNGLIITKKLVVNR